MKRHFVFGALLVFMLVLSGCPMQTAVSIDNGSMDMPGWLKGDWHSESGASRYYTEAAPGKGQVKIYDSDEGHANHTNPRKGILSNIDGTIFLSVYFAGDEDSEKGYYLYEITRLSDSELELKEIKSSVLTYNASSTAIKDFLTANKGDQRIYDEKTKYNKDL